MKRQRHKLTKHFVTHNTYFNYFCFMAMKWYLEYITQGQGRRYITEPEGADNIPFTMEREEDRQAVDVTYAGGTDAEFTITPLAQLECFDMLIMYLELYGQEAQVYIGVEIGETDYKLGEVDFANCETDMVNYFRFQAINYGKKAVFKRRIDAPTNVTGFKDLDNNTVEPLIPEKIFAPALPFEQFSSWRAANGTAQQNLIFRGSDVAFIAPFPQQVKSGIDNSYAPSGQFLPGINFQYPDGTALNTPEERTRFRDESTIIRAASTLLNVKVSIKNFNLFVGVSGFFLLTEMSINWGQGYDGAGAYNRIVLFSTNSLTVDIQNASYDVTIPVLNNTDKLWISVTIQSNVTRTPAPRSTAFVSYHSGQLEITTTNIAPSSVIYGLKVHDIMRKNAEMSARLAINAPRWDKNGEFQYEYMTTKNLIRKILDRPVNISTKDIAEDYLPFCKGDYLVKDDEVFYGREPDFFRKFQCGSYPQVQNTQYKRILNPDFLINLFKFGYTNVQSQKENETANTNEDVHYNSVSLLPSKKTDSTFDVQVGVIRSAFSIEQARRDAFRLAFENKENAATQDDDKLYSVDVLPFGVNDPERSQKYTAALQHQVKGILLRLTNKGDFSWVLLGIEPNYPFSITAGANVRNYTVITVTDQYIELLPVIPTNQLENVAESNTSFTYRIGNSTKLKFRTNQGFSFVSGLSQPERYPNLRYTVKRCILNYWQRYLATCLIYNPYLDVNVIEYNNNPNAITQLTGEALAIREGDSYKPVEPILSGILHQNISLEMSFEEYKELEQNIQEERGFIATWDGQGLPIKGFIKTGSFQITSDKGDIIMGNFTCTLEELYEQAIMQLFYDGNVLSINNKIMPSGIHFSIDELQKLSIFDASGKRILYPVMWNRVSYNGVIPQTQDELQQFLNGI